MSILAAATDPAWVERALAHLDLILVDHAHCEKKAASTALGLIFRHPDKTALLAPLSRLAREELSHFEEVLEVLAKRGVVFARLDPSPYASELMSIVRDRDPKRLLDTLLCCALIEARSCERMRILADRLEDAELAKMYRGLLAAEARHHRAYVDLARDVGLFEESEIRTRLAEIAVHEAAVIARAPHEPRLHN
jgi:tRNA 2-(methylsulfanyl)-N6-isopentenyladenosine37 hydroxylase